MLPRYIPRNCYTGLIVGTAPTNTPVARLFNKSTGRDLMIVREIRGLCTTSTSEFLLRVGASQGFSGTAGGTTAPVVSGEAGPAAQLYMDDTASPPAASFIVADSGFDNALVWAKWPLFILLPGWSAFVFPTITATALTVAFYWQWAGAEDIDGTFGDYALRLASS